METPPISPSFSVADASNQLLQVAQVRYLGGGTAGLQLAETFTSSVHYIEAVIHHRTYRLNAFCLLL